MNARASHRRGWSGPARALGAALVVAWALASAACTRAHLTPTHGRAYHEAFTVQGANPNRKADAQAVNGLDSQEASIIAGNYRKALSPKDEGSGANHNQLLMVSPNMAPAGANMPAPSVPNGN